MVTLQTAEFDKGSLTSHSLISNSVHVLIYPLNRNKDNTVVFTCLLSTIMSNQRNKKAKSLRAAPGKKSRVNKNDSRSGSVWSIPKWLGFPDATRATLRYIIPLAQLTGGGTTNSFRYTSNAYDVDAALASTAMAYFAELAVVYSRFRTLGMRYHFKITNQEAFPCQTIYGFMTNSLGSTSVGANYSGNPYMKSDILSAINGSRSTSTYEGGCSIENLFGSNQALFDDLFTGSTTSSTLSSSATANLYIGTVSASVPVNGQFVCGWVELDVLFNRRNSLIV